MAEALLEVIVCPQCLSRLRPEPNDAMPTRLICTDKACALAFPVRDGVPVLLVDEAAREH
ncbi:MAG TPA: Trm112 family protein [Actinomycetes bacterium]|nr:Trm112 family protein [Actinomycetes bacterium]